MFRAATLISDFLEHTDAERINELASRLLVPPTFVLILLSVEDKRFLTHRGIDYIGAARALIADLLVLHWAQGASTITQQLIRIRLPDVRWPAHRSVHTKVRQIRLALMEERKSDKETILRDYLSAVYLGRGKYGLADASEVYFGVEPLYLTPAQSLFLTDRLAMPARASAERVVDLVTRRPIAPLFRLAELSELCDVYDRYFDCGEEIWRRLAKSPKRSAAHMFTY